MLQPHLRRALAVNRCVAALKHSIFHLARAVDALDVAIVGLRRDRTISFANARADYIFRNSGILAVRNRRLCATDPAAHDHLDKMIATAFRRQLATLPGGSLISTGSRRLVLTVLPANNYFSEVAGNASVYVIITDPDLRPSSRSQLLATLFGVTPAEARVVMLLLHDPNTNKIAEKTPGTVRFQLKSIFRKVGVTSQGQLIRLISRIPGMVEVDS